MCPFKRKSQKKKKNLENLSKWYFAPINLFCNTLHRDLSPLCCFCTSAKCVKEGQAKKIIVFQAWRSNYLGRMCSRPLLRLKFFIRVLYEKANEPHSVGRWQRAGQKLLIWRFWCLSWKGRRQREPATGEAFRVTVSASVFNTPAASNVALLLLLSWLETNGLFRAYFICTCGERAERKCEAPDGSALDVVN